MTKCAYIFFSVVKKTKIHGSHELEETWEPLEREGKEVNCLFLKNKGLQNNLNKNLCGVPIFFEAEIDLHLSHAFSKECREKKLCQRKSLLNPKVPTLSLDKMAPS